MVEQCFLIRSLTWEQPLNSLIYWANGCATAETYMRLNVFTGGRVKIGGMYCVCVCAINMTLKMTKRVVSNFNCKWAFFTPCPTTLQTCPTTTLCAWEGEGELVRGCVIHWFTVTTTVIVSLLPLLPLLPLMSLLPILSLLSLCHYCHCATIVIVTNTVTTDVVICIHCIDYTPGYKHNLVGMCVGVWMHMCDCCCLAGREHALCRAVLGWSFCC